MAYVIGFTKPQKKLIKACKKLGWGYKKFAKSVEAGGFCTDKQEATMRNMLSTHAYNKARVESARSRPSRPSYYYCD